MNQINKIVMSLEFADVILPVSQNEQGEDIVPIKPISDLFGLKWENQRVRINKPSWAKRLGTCTTPPKGGADQQRNMTCVRLNRVVAFLNSINPEQVRSQGNENGADFLEQKQEEWDDLIHEYEMAGGIFDKNESLKMTAESRLRRDYFSTLNNLRKYQSLSEKEVLEGMAQSLASRLGFPYQQDLLNFDRLIEIDNNLANIQDENVKAQAKKAMESILKGDVEKPISK